jgi:ATP-binding cassette subfamily B protein
MKKPAPDLTRFERRVLEAAADPILRLQLAEERVESASVDSALFGRLLGYIKPHWKWALVALCFATMEALLLSIPAWLIGVAVDSLNNTVEGSGARWVVDTATAISPSWMEPPAAAVFVGFGAIMLLVWGLRWLLGVASIYVIQMLGQRVVHDLRTETYNHILGMDLGYFHRNPVGRLVNRTTFDVQSLSELFSDAVAEGSRDILFVIVLLAVMMVLDWKLALVLLLAFPALAVCAEAYRRMGRPALRSMSAVQSRMNGWLAENIAGMRDNQLFGRQNRRRAEFESLTQAHQTSVVGVVRAWALLRPAMMLTSGLTSTAVLLLGSSRVAAGTLTLGILLTFLQYTAKLWVPVRNIAEKFSLVQTALTAAERIADVLDKKSAISDRVTPGTPEAARAPRHGAIEFKNVTFNYPGTTAEVLRNVSFRAPAGQMLALVGDTGAGKSTIAHLLSRFYDTTTGTVEIDDVQVGDYTLANLRRSIALVPQDIVVFAGTLRDNFTLGREVSDERIWQALRAVQADKVVERFPDGLDHVMEESGKTLSQGERQLLAFARALVADPPILILDEATANIDTETEQRIQQALGRLLEGRTAVVIAHRLSTIQHADQILVMRHGEVIERGTHDSLLAMNGDYARLYQSHLRDVGSPH